MATVRGWALRGNVQRAIDYITNPDKTKDLFVHSTSGHPSVTGLEWKIRNNILENNVGRSGKETYAGYHFQISFPPGEVTEEQCYSIADEWIKRAFGNDYNYVIAVHNDKPHMHAHIVFNPVSKRTGKIRRVMFKRELPKLKMISDNICKQRGLSVLPFKDNDSKSYFEWMQHGDSYKEIIRKTIDGIIPKVTKYEELKNYMNALGFEIEDSFENELDSHREFTVDEILFLQNKSCSDEKISFRIPRCQGRYYMTVDAKNVQFYNDGKSLKCRIDESSKNNFSVFEMKSGTKVEMSTEQILKYFEDKTKKKNQCRIKTPNGKKFIITEYIKNEESGYGYSLEDIMSRIKNNGRTELDPEVADVISDGVNIEKERQSKLRRNFYTSNNIRVPYDRSEYYEMSKKDRYLKFRTDEIQRIFDNVAEINRFNNDGVNLESLENSLEAIKKEYSVITKELAVNEKIYQQMVEEAMEDTLEISQEQLESWSRKNIVPLQKKRTKLKDMYQSTNDMLDKYKKLMDKINKTTADKNTKDIIPKGNGGAR